MQNPVSINEAEGVKSDLSPLNCCDLDSSPPHLHARKETETGLGGEYLTKLYSRQENIILMTI